MEYRIVSRDEFFIIGFMKRISLQFHGENHQIDSLRDKLTGEVIRELETLNDVEPKGIVCVSANFSDRTKEGSLLDQYIGVASSSPCSSYDVLSVPASEWAVFPSCGKYPDTLQNTWAGIYSVWLPSSDYELTGGPEILRNYSSDAASPDLRSEIWIPVRKRK